MQYHAAVGHSKSRMRHCLQRGTVRFVPSPSKRLKPLSVCDTALRLVRRASLCSSTMNANARRTRAQRACALFGGAGQRVLLQMQSTASVSSGPNHPDVIQIN